MKTVADICGHGVIFTRQREHQSQLWWR